MQYSKLRRNSFAHKYIYVVFLFQKTKRGLRKSFMQSNSVFTVQPLQSISTPLYTYKQAATGSQEFQGSCTWFMQNNSVFTVQALQYISISLHVYKQAATGSQEFQDPCTWFGKTILSLLCRHYNLYLSLYMYTNKQQQVLRNSKIPAHGSCKTILSLLCSHYNLYLSIYMYTNKLQRVLRNSKIPAHGSCKTILSLLCRHYNLYLLLYMYTNKLQQVLRNSKIPAHGTCKVILYLHVQALQSISIPLHVYKQAATGSQEFQDPCTWFMQNNSVFTVQPLQSISISLHVYKQAAMSSQEFQDPCTWFMQNNSALLCRHYNLYLLLYMYTNKLQQVFRSSKIPAHGPLNVILCTTQMQQVLRKVKTPDVVQPCKATLRIPRTCPGHQKEGHGSIPLE